MFPVVKAYNIFLTETLYFIIHSRSLLPVSLHNWHKIHVSRTGGLAFLEVDEQDPQSVLSEGSFTELSSDQNLYLGGIPTFRLVSPYVPMRRNFQGCVQKVCSPWNLSI